MTPLLGFLQAVIALNVKLLPVALHLIHLALANPQLLPDIKAAQADPAKLEAVIADVASVLGIAIPTTTT